ncbi:hypothetical protein Droror1_Dr00001840 [Drosera rotundifolia]
MDFTNRSQLDRIESNPDPANLTHLTFINSTSFYTHQTNSHTKSNNLNTNHTANQTPTNHTKHATSPILITQTNNKSLSQQSQSHRNRHHKRIRSNSNEHAMYQTKPNRDLTSMIRSSKCDEDDEEDEY